MHLFPSMWAYEHHFHTEDVDDGHMTQECRVKFDFNEYSHVIHRDQNIIHQKIGYIRNIQEIIRVDFSSFQCVSFRCKWWDTFDRNNVKEDCDSGMIYVSSLKICGTNLRSLMFSQNTATKCFFTQICWIGIDGLY
jgi:hypothetical protein